MEPADENRNALISNHPFWIEQTLHGLFDAVAARHPERPAILTRNGTWSYQHLAEASRNVGAALVQAGIPIGSRIALIMANFPEFICIKLAIARAGCVAVPVNFQLRVDELTYVLEQAECSAVFGMAEFRGRDYLSDYATLLEFVPSLKYVIVRETIAPSAEHISGLDTFTQNLTPLSYRQLAEREQAVKGHSPSDIVYTSGTTGKPKGAILTHDMLLRSAFSSALTRSFEDGRKILFALPMYHVFGYVECWIAGLFVGGAIIPQTVFDPETMADLAEEFSATDIVCVPVMTHALIDEVRKRGHFAQSVRAYFNSGGVNVPTVWTEIAEVLGAGEIHTAYGMTETTASTMCTRAEDPVERLLDSNGQYKLAGPAGDPSLGNRIALYRVVDPLDGTCLPPGEGGELQVRGPVVTKGYFRKPEETRAAFTDDGWFRTGDIGHLTADGFLTLTGRIKEAYRCGGEMVMPREIEVFLERDPAVGRVLVVGVPDARMGEVGCVCVITNPSVAVDGTALIERCKMSLARFKVPKYVISLAEDEIPMTPTGRPQKFALAKLAAERLGLA